MTTTVLPATTAVAAPEPAGVHKAVRYGSLFATLAVVAVLYLYDLGASGYANSFYSAAAQAGSQNWEAFLYGSLDAGNSITVDKTPASLWLMALSIRIFGLSSWSILVPQALLGVASAAVLYATVRRSLSGPVTPDSWQITPTRAHWAGIVAALAMALTPAATLMFRFNNPDALMVFCYVAASYATVRAAETASRRWLAGAGALIGLAFLAKMLQAFVVLPSLILAYVIAAPASWRKKVVDLVVAFAAMVVTFGWYIALVELVPASMRPYIGGSQNNSILELTFGYNGLGRLNGNETGSVGGGGGNAGGNWGSTGIGRMFTTVSGEMVSWLIPAALILSLVALILVGRRAYANVLRRGQTTTATLATGGLVLFSSWLVINGLVFSFMAGIYHDYYTVALAPAIAGAVAIGGTILLARRDNLVARIGLALAFLATAAWAIALATVPGGIYLVATIMAAPFLILAALALLIPSVRGRLAAAAVTVAVAAGLVGPVAYSLNTAATPHTGSIVTAGPARSGLVAGQGGPGGMRGGQGAPGQGTDGRGTAGAPGQGTDGRGTAGQPPAGQPGQTGTQTQPGQGTDGQGTDGRGGAGGMGGLLNGATVPDARKTLLSTNASDYTWVAATTGSQNAASYQLGTGYPVMAIGGFNGSDPSPTPDQFKALVAEGKIHYFIGAGNFGGQNGGSSSASEIASWVSANYTAQTVGGVTVYDLTTK